MLFFKAKIQGTTAMLQHRFSEQAEQPGTTRRVASGMTDTPREAAEKAAYRKPDGSLYFPASSIGRLLRESGGGHKLKGSRKSAKYVVPAATLVLDESISLIDPETGKALRDFEVDSRPVVIPATKGRIMRHRPRLEKWGGEFTIRINELLLEPKFLLQLLVEGGQQLGMGDYRPEKGGPYGTFQVVSWSEVERKAEAAE
jgi:hypothetical protein